SFSTRPPSPKPLSPMQVSGLGYCLRQPKAGKFPMGIKDIRDAASIREAMGEFDRVGRTYFLEKYGFRKSREFMVRDQATGRLYDSKAIVGAAYGYAFPE